MILSILLKNNILVSPNSYTIITCLATIIFLLVCSSLVSASEVAFFSMDPSDKDKLRESTDKSSLLAQKLINSPQNLLATILIANNFVNIGVVITSSFLLNEIYPSNESNELTRFLIDVFLITTIILLVGEVVPKVYATKNSLPIVRMMARPIFIISKAPPFSWIRIFLVNGTKIIHRYAKKRSVQISSDELEQILALTKEETTSEEEHKILEGIVKFGNTDVKQIMTPRMEVIAIDSTENYTETLNIIINAGYSRIPVYENSFDNVIGVLYIKDLIPFLTEQATFNWKNLIRKPFFVPENKKLDDLLNEFQSKKMHMAIVVDEYGGANGIVTLEDILEEIVGDITDEFDEEEIHYTKIDENTYIFEGKTALIDFYKILNIDGKEFELKKGEVDTLGGFIVEQAGRILMNKEFIEFDNYKLQVESSNKKKIKSVKIIILDAVNSSENESF
jgi:putative hemolysin